MENALPTATRISSISPIIKLSAALRYFAEGGYQTGCGNEHMSGLAQSTFSKVLTQVVNILESEICADFIKFSTSSTEKERIKLSFYSKRGFPGVIGCVDGTHFKILTPSKEIKHLYLNRKGFYSINGMLVSNKIYFVKNAYLIIFKYLFRYVMTECVLHLLMLIILDRATILLSIVLVN